MTTSLILLSYQASLSSFSEDIAWSLTPSKILESLERCKELACSLWGYSVNNLQSVPHFLILKTACVTIDKILVLIVVVINRKSNRMAFLLALWIVATLCRHKHWPRSRPLSTTPNLKRKWQTKASLMMPHINPCCNWTQRSVFQECELKFCPIKSIIYKEALVENSLPDQAMWAL